MKTILIADNMKDNLETLSLILSDYNIRQASTVEAAIDIIENESIDLVVSDISFDQTTSNKDGVMIIKKSKEHGIPSIAITAILSKADIELECIEAGAIRVIVGAEDFTTKLLETISDSFK